MPTTESDTPRSNAAYKDWISCADLGGKIIAENAAEFSKIIEHELNAANQLCVDQNNNLILQQQKIDKLEQANQLLEVGRALKDDMKIFSNIKSPCSEKCCGCITLEFIADENAWLGKCNECAKELGWAKPSCDNHEDRERLSKSKI